MDEESESGEQKIKCKNVFTNIFDEIENAYTNIKELLTDEYDTNKNIKEDARSVTLIKEYLDSLKTLQLFIKPLIGVRYQTEYEKDYSFYDKLYEYWDKMQDITSIYNQTRNYLTGKPYSTNKIKLNFNNPTLLNGWAKGNEIANSSLIFRQNDNYYIGIINSKYNKEFKRYAKPSNEDDILEKMEYLQAADPQRDIQNLMCIDGVTQKKNGRKDSDDENRLLENLKNEYLPKEINDIRKRKSYSKTSDSFSKEDLVKFIDYYKERTIEYFDSYTFNFKPSCEYSDFREFTSHVNEQAYQIKFEQISKKQIEEFVEDGKLYLFQIYSKDFSSYTSGKPNLHTLYWKMLFDENNLKDIVYKLNGKAEIFYRKASIERKITHPKGQNIPKKNNFNKNEFSHFEFDLIKDKRFTEDKFLFHVPITLNFKNIGMNEINEYTNKAIKENDENYIIGIDRGERHLLYYVLINSKGEIIKGNSFNIIENSYNGTKHRVDYHDLLNQKERERDTARKSWQTIENIKNLKEGYLSQVINEITNLMIEYNAIVILEDLNFGFMQSRQKVEKQVYHKFEKMLIDKLNYLVKKDIDKNNPGGLLKAYQLTNQFESFQKLEKQSGMLYYIPAWNTSKIDPTTGFTNLFYIKYESENKAKDFCRKIDYITYNNNADYFEFDIDYNKFTTKAEGTKTCWKLCTYGNRIKTFRNSEKSNQWDSVKVDLTSEFKKLFEEFNIDISSRNLKDEILCTTGKKFWEEFIYLFRLMLQMRNSVTGTEEDYLISPVQNSSGEFYDSRTCNNKLPTNADENGAYNIARKGLWIVEQIKKTPYEELEKIKLAISNKEWLQFAQRQGNGEK